MKKYGLQILTLLLCAVLLIVVLKQRDELAQANDQLNHVSYDLKRIQQNVSDVSSRVYQIVEESNRLVSDYTLQPVGMDRESNNLRAELSVTLKEWRDDTKANLLVMVEDVCSANRMTGIGNGVFVATVTLPTELSGDELRLELTVDHGGTSRRETLGSWKDLSQLLPLRSGGYGGLEPTPYDGTLEGTSLMFTVYDREGVWPEVQEPQFHFYQNDKLLWSKPGIKEETYGSYYFTDPEEEWSVPFEEGDNMVITFSCKDDGGLTYEFFCLGWDVEEWTETYGAIANYDPPEGVYPKLIWE